MPANTFIFFLFILCLPGWLTAQHSPQRLDTVELIDFRKSKPYPSPLDTWCSTTYEEIFTCHHPYIRLSPNHHKTVMKHHIRSISVLSGRCQLLARFEFDSSGMLTAQGSATSYYNFYGHSRYFNRPGDSLREVRSFYRDNILLRTDSLFHIMDEHRHGNDTGSIKMITYKKGELMNMQYQFYNETYGKSSEYGSSCDQEMVGPPPEQNCVSFIYNPGAVPKKIAPPRKLEKHPFYTRFRVDSLYKTKITYSPYCVVYDSRNKYFFRGEKFFEASCCRQAFTGCAYKALYGSQTVADYLEGAQGLPATRYQKTRYYISHSEAGLRVSEPEAVNYIEYTFY